MIQRILAAVDGSPREAGVLRIAAELATRFHSTVHLFRVMRIPPEIPPAAHAHPDSLEQVLVTEALEQLTQLAVVFPDAKVERPEISDAEPWRSILGAARRLDVDLIVIGSHGYGGWDRLLGTTAASVVNRADRHVWVVHDRTGGAVEE